MLHKFGGHKSIFLREKKNKPLISVFAPFLHILLSTGKSVILLLLTISRHLDNISYFFLRFLFCFLFLQILKNSCSRRAILHIKT